MADDAPSRRLPPFFLATLGALAWGAASFLWAPELSLGAEMGAGTPAAASSSGLITLWLHLACASVWAVSGGVLLEVRRHGASNMVQGLMLRWLPLPVALSPGLVAHLLVLVLDPVGRFGAALCWWAAAALGLFMGVALVGHLGARALVTPRT